MTGGKPAPGVGRARLNQHRPALRAARDVERPGDLVEIAAVVDRPDALRSRVLAARPVVDDRIGGPAVPERLDDGHELFAPGIAVGVADLTGSAEIARRRREPR